MSNKVKRDANEDGLVYKALESIIKKEAQNGHQNQPASPEERMAKMGEARDAAKNMSDNFVLRGQEPNIDQVLKNATQDQRGVALYPFTQQEIAQLRQWIAVDINNTKQFFAQHPEELAKRRQEAGINVPQAQPAVQPAK